MNHYKKIALTLSLGAVALITQFVFKQPLIARIMITVAGLYIAFTMLLEMFKTLKSGKYGIDILAITAIVATLAIGEYWASLMILIMLVGGDALEDYAGNVAKKELQTLLDNTPMIAHVEHESELQDVPVDEVQVSQILVVKPHEVVPVDGELLSDNASMDQSSLTGESALVDKKTGDALMSGSINGDEAVRMKVLKLAQDSEYQQIIKLVKESEAKPAKFVRLADEYAVPFTIVAYVIAGVAWFVSKDPRRFAEVLVVASPCPLILAAPIAIVAGQSKLSKNSVVVKSGTSIEKMASSKTIAFDKTGTITKGKIAVDNVYPAPGISRDLVLALAASVEAHSTHVIANSIVEAAKNTQQLQAIDVEEKTAYGVEGMVDGQLVRVGKRTFVSGVPQGLDTDNKTVVFVSRAKQFIGYITFNDHIKPEAKHTIERLKELGLEHIMMLTGDHKPVAEIIAKQVGITEVHADCLPKDKIDILNAIPEDNRPSVMVGDGVNDAPALAIADTGIAIGTGATSASESADVVLLSNNLESVADAVSISKHTMIIARQAVLIGIAICTVLMLIAATGVIPALIGAILQEVVDTVSILYSLRARK